MVVCIENLPASIASLSTLAVPVCGVLFSWWLLGENPGAVEGSGIVLIVLALALVSRKKKRSRQCKKDLNFSSCGEISYLAKYR